MRPVGGAGAVRLLHAAAVAQLAEHLTRNEKVWGSIPHSGSYRRRSGAVPRVAGRPCCIRPVVRGPSGPHAAALQLTDGQRTFATWQPLRESTTAAEGVTPRGRCEVDALARKVDRPRVPTAPAAEGNSAPPTGRRMTRRENPAGDLGVRTTAAGIHHSCRRFESRQVLAGGPGERGLDPDSMATGAQPPSLAPTAPGPRAPRSVAQMSSKFSSCCWLNGSNMMDRTVSA